VNVRKKATSQRPLDATKRTDARALARSLARALAMTDATRPSRAKNAKG